MMFLLSKQKDTALLLEADNKAELIQQLRLHPEAVVILDYTLFDFTGADELIVLHERFKTADWLLFSDELSVGFLRQVLLSAAGPQTRPIVLNTSAVVRQKLLPMPGITILVVA